MKAKSVVAGSAIGDSYVELRNRIWLRLAATGYAITLVSLVLVMTFEGYGWPPEAVSYQIRVAAEPMSALEVIGQWLGLLSAGGSLVCGLSLAMGIMRARMFFTLTFMMMLIEPLWGRPLPQLLSPAAMVVGDLATAFGALTLVLAWLVSRQYLKPE